MKQNRVLESVLVMNFKAEGIESSYAVNISNLITVTVEDFNRFKVISMADVKEILEQQYIEKLLGCTNSSCLVELGGAVGAKYLVYGSIGKLADNYLINLNLLKVAELKVVKRIQLVVEDEKRLLDNVRKGVSKLFGFKLKSNSNFLRETNFFHIKTGIKYFTDLDGMLTPGFGGNFESIVQFSNYRNIFAGMEIGYSKNYFKNTFKTMDPSLDINLKDELSYSNILAKFYYYFMVESEVVWPFLSLGTGFQYVSKKAADSKEIKAKYSGINDINYYKSDESIINLIGNFTIGIVGFPLKTIGFYAATSIDYATSFSLLKEFSFDVYKGVIKKQKQIENVFLVFNVGLNLSF